MSALTSYLYNSGVGWINNILEIDVFVETDVETYTKLPHFTRIDPLSPEERSAASGRRTRRRAERAAEREAARAAERARVGTDSPSREVVDVKDDSGDEEDDDDEATAPQGGASASAVGGRYLSSFIPLVAAGQPVRGVVCIRAPAGRTIPFVSVAVSLETTLFALEEVKTRSLFEEVLELLGTGSVTDVLEVPFSFLEPAGTPLHESFEGELFSLRHEITVRVERPWYTFDCGTTVPIGVQRVHSLPIIDDGEDEAALASPSAAYATPLSDDIVRGDWSALGPQKLPLANWAPNPGSIVFEFDTAVLELSETLRGRIVCMGMEMPIVFMKLAVIRIEYADGEARDSLVFDDTIMDARRWRARKTAAASAKKGASRAKEASSASLSVAEIGAGTGLGESAPSIIPVVTEGDGLGDGSEVPGRSEWYPTDADLAAGEAGDPDMSIVKDVSLSVSLDLSQLNLSPTITQPGDADDVDEDGGEDVVREVFSVRYFVRVAVFTSFHANARVWDAQEIFLYRSGFYGQMIAPHKRLPRWVAAPEMKPASALAGAAGIPPARNASRSVSERPQLAPDLAPAGTGGSPSTSHSTPSVIALDVGDATVPSPLRSNFTGAPSGSGGAPTSGSKSTSPRSTAF